MDQYEKVAAKIVMRATSEFNPFDLIGSLQTTPIFISTLVEANQDLRNVFSGNTSIERFFRKNLNFLEIIPNPETKR